MTKLIDIDPHEILSEGDIRFKDIPAFQYKKIFADEKNNFLPAELLGIYRDMCCIREVETMLGAIKMQGEYNGVRHHHPGPAHLGIGQEAMYVGEAFHLDVDDIIFGTHRCHGDVIAKAMRTVALLDEDRLLAIMEGYLGGTVYHAVADDSRPIREVARDFVLYGFISEVFAKANGFNRGLGGPMHAFFVPFGIYPNNALVGASADIAVGAALNKLINDKPGVVVCNTGDGSLACGPVWEALCFSSMDQYRTLWQSGGVPLIFNVSDNFYGMGGQTRGETMAYGVAARVAAGVSKNMLHAERINGLDVFAVMDAYKRLLPVAKADGPVLMDVMTYRTCPHSCSDSGSYRTQAEVDAWRAHDPIARLGTQLTDVGLCDEGALAQLRLDVQQDVLRCLKLAVDDGISPLMDMGGSGTNALEKLMYSNASVRAFGAAMPEVLLPKEKCPALTALSGKARFCLDADGRQLPKEAVYSFRNAVAEPIINKFYEDSSLIAFGEEVRDWGGAFGVYNGFTEALPYKRLFNSPIAEGAIVGAATGYAMCGGRVVAEVMYNDFMGRAGDELFNQLAKWQAMSAGTLKMPVVLRMSVGYKYGAQHSQDFSAMLAHVPGLKVVYPATPYDAKGLMQSALNGSDPVVFLESQRLYDMGEMFHAGGVPDKEYELPIGVPDIKREGEDITILSIGAALYRASEAAQLLKERHGLSAELIDARSLVPFDYDIVVRSVKKTHRIVVVGDAVERGSFMHTLASNISSLCFADLAAAPAVVGARNWITPAHEYTEAFFPTPQRILTAMCAVMGNDADMEEVLRRSREGV
ncbi:MAG: thiamine pyrophosphate-dependent enzyme [Clostridia bacterium]